MFIYKICSKVISYTVSIGRLFGLATLIVAAFSMEIEELTTLATPENSAERLVVSRYQPMHVNVYYSSENFGEREYSPFSDAVVLLDRNWLQHIGGILALTNKITSTLMMDYDWIFRTRGDDGASQKGDPEKLSEYFVDAFITPLTSGAGDQLVNIGHVADIVDTSLTSLINTSKLYFEIFILWNREIAMDISPLLCALDINSLGVISRVLSLKVPHPRLLPVPPLPPIVEAHGSPANYYAAQNSDTRKLQALELFFTLLHRHCSQL